MGGRRSQLRWGVLLVACLVGTVAGRALLLSNGSAAAGGSTTYHSGKAVARRAARLSFTGRNQMIPASFFGISVEYNEISAFEDHGASFGRALALMRPGNETLVPLRIGGRSANDVYWNVPT
ncbi:MAG: hypothetical protein ACTHQQ_13190, partial [Solirubrobacteraceae bacterium]